MDSVSATVASPSVSEHAQRHAGARRGVFLKWLRKTHGWMGLWGALLGLMFGLTGIVQNHRAVLKISTPAPVVTNIRVQVPDTVPQTPEDVSVWLSRELGLPGSFTRVTRTPSQPVAWGDRTMRQPERWQMMFRTPSDMVQVEYWPDSRQVSARRSVPGWWGVVENLHKGNGAGVAWVLLTDSIAGCMILLSLTGLLLWTGLERKKLVGAVVFVASVVATLAVTAVTL
jgi:hypothetical protein